MQLACSELSESGTFHSFFNMGIIKVNNVI